MPYINPEDGSTHYRTLEDLVLELISQPDALFIRDSGCEALVYIEELDTIILIECKDLRDQGCSHEVCEAALRDKLAHIRAFYQL